MNFIAGHHQVKRGALSPFQLNGFESFAVSKFYGAFLHLCFLMEHHVLVLKRLKCFAVPTCGFGFSCNGRYTNDPFHSQRYGSDF
jgi:hypothetical protein